MSNFGLIEEALVIFRERAHGLFSSLCFNERYFEKGHLTKKKSGAGDGIRARDFWA